MNCGLDGVFQRPAPLMSLQTPPPWHGQCRWSFWLRQPRKPVCCSPCQFLSCSRNLAYKATLCQGGAFSLSCLTSTRSFLPSCLFSQHSSSLPSHLPAVLFLLQETEVLLWWPRDHGDRHGYHLTVRGQQDSHLLINAESKVRWHTYCLQSVYISHSGVTHWCAVRNHLMCCGKCPMCVCVIINYIKS